MVVALKDHKIVAMWFPVLINKLRIVPFDLGSIVTGSYPGLNIDIDMIFVFYQIQARCKP